MTFRKRFTLILILLVACIIGVLSQVILYFSVRYKEQDYFDRMRERAYTTAQVYLKRDELNTTNYKIVLRKYQRYLINEEIYIYKSDQSPAFDSDSLDKELHSKIFSMLDDKEYIEFNQGEQQWVGIQYHDNQGKFYVVVSAYDAVGKRKINNLSKILLACFFGSIIIVGLISRFLLNQVLRPIAEIVQRANEISASSLHLRLQESQAKDEVAELSKTFNKMLDRLQTSFEMQKNFISNASHELRNPLTAISGEIEVALVKKRTPEEYIASLETLQKETNRLEQLTSVLLALAQMGFNEADLLREQIRADELLMECLKELQGDNAVSNVKLHMEELPESPEELLIKGNYSLLKVAIGNVLENAIKFSDKQEVQVWLKRENEAILITVQDNGIGIPQEELPHIFQTFYRARNARGHRGTGIGLSLTDKIIRMHNGMIQISSAENKGTTVSILFKPTEL